MITTQLRRAAVYCRVSSPVQALRGYSLGEQRDLLPEDMRRRGFRVDDADVFVEVQTGTDDSRPEYNRMMALVLDGYYQAVMVVETSRLTRTESRAEEDRIIATLQANGCLLMTPNITFDASTLEGEWMLDMNNSNSRLERKRMKTRMQGGKLGKLKQGGYIGGNPPTGYQFEIDPETRKMRFGIDDAMADVVRYIFRLAADGISMRQIAALLNEAGYKSQRGNRFSTQAIRGILRNRHYIGHTVSRAKNITLDHSSYIDAIIDQDTFNQVQVMLAQRSMKTRAPNKKHPLSGLIRCQSCGHPMIANMHRRKNIYRCRDMTGKRMCTNKGSRMIPMSEAHKLVVSLLPHLFERLEIDAPRAGKAIAKINAGPKPSARTSLLKQQQKIIQAIRRHLIDQETSFSQFRAQRIAELETEHHEVTEKLAAAQGAKITVPELSGWQELTKAITPDDVDLLAILSENLFAEIRYKADGTGRNTRYRLTSIKTSWGLKYNVLARQSLSYKGF